MTPEGDKASILIVDDHEENLEAFEAILQDLGQNIVKARSGEEALRRLYHQDFAVILLDVRMPGMDGLETAALIRARPRSRHIPIIFVTAFDDPLERITRGYSIGAVDYIVKPVHPEILRSKVRVFVELFLKTRSLEREVQERRRAEEELRAANRELEAFSYSVSHDLRGPLRAITGFSEILLEEYADKLEGGMGRDCLNRIADGARQMDALIQDLLTFSRLGRDRIELTEVDPAEVLSESIARVEVGQADIAIQGPFAPLRANRVLLTQVFYNLISNAVKFVPPGVRPVVRIRSERHGERVRIWVEDNGIGIAPEYHDRIFRVFERLNPSSGYPGTGIGLAIVRRAMERMGGKVGLESSPGQGSRFWIELPAASAPKTDPRPQR
ncbi:MAG TPA: ATP-binding protein [Planctomycetota bacterium]|nr:ATP-binding protein [Planctomycetota bacterium]